ncbi:hypothetical protein BD779DRAFT_1471290 [Infundibulicybe gibba]|nr:hypothetical protein BD779DRAFT_1471290 [Infundibulicybe gibba]
MTECVRILEDRMGCPIFENKCLAAGGNLNDGVVSRSPSRNRRTWETVVNIRRLLEKRAWGGNTQMIARDYGAFGTAAMVNIKEHALPAKVSRHSAVKAWGKARNIEMAVDGLAQRLRIIQPKRLVPLPRPLVSQVVWNGIVEGTGGTVGLGYFWARRRLERSWDGGNWLPLASVSEWDIRVGMASLEGRGSFKGITEKFTATPASLELKFLRW